MLYCRTTKKRCKGAAAEQSQSADNYREEILGRILVQLVLRAASQRRILPYCPVVVECDNRGVVNHGNTPTRALKVKEAQADALRSFKQILIDHPCNVSYEWVKAHQDDVKNWTQLSLNEKLNVIGDGMAKKYWWRP